MFVEVRTLLVVFVVFSVLGVFVMASLWQQNRKRSPEIFLWLVEGKKAGNFITTSWLPSSP